MSNAKINRAMLAEICMSKVINLKRDIFTSYGGGGSNMKYIPPCFRSSPETKMGIDGWTGGRTDGATP